MGAIQGTPANGLGPFDRLVDSAQVASSSTTAMITMRMMTMISGVVTSFLAVRRCQTVRFNPA